MRSPRRVVAGLLLLACWFAEASTLTAQETSEPPPQENDTLLDAFPSSDVVPRTQPGIKPMSPREKWALGTEESFAPLAFLALGANAGYGQIENRYPSFGQGVEGYGRRYGAAFGDHAVSDYLTASVFPVLFREDPRYFRSGHGAFFRRLAYSVGRIAITRTDAGTNRTNVSEFLGNAVAAGISNTYLPSPDRGVANTAHRFGLFLASDALNNVLKEFWPDVRRKLFHR